MLQNDCIFCKIINQEIQADIVLENSDYIVIQDIHPKAPTHLLIIPKTHSDGLHDFNTTPAAALLLLDTIKTLNSRLENPSFKIQINNGTAAGQEVFHLHIHFTSSSKLKST